MRVLVTGANGFVGTAMCAHLVSARTEVIGAVRRKTDAVAPGVSQVVVGELGGSATWDAAMRGVSGVIHLAAKVDVMGHPAAAKHLDDFRRINVAGTVALAHSAAAMGVQRFVFVSSVKVHGEERDVPYSEGDGAAPEEPYGQSKWEAEQALRAIERSTGMEVVIVRPPLVYGPRVRANFLKLMELTHRGIPFPFGLVHNRRSLVFVGNLAHALETCLRHPAAAGRTFLISDGEDVSTAELIRRLGTAMGVPVRLLPVPLSMLRIAARLGGRIRDIERLAGSLAVDSRAIHQQLNWKPLFSMHEGLAATAAHYWATHAR